MIQCVKMTHALTRVSGFFWILICVQMITSIGMEPKSRRGIFSYWFLVTQSHPHCSAAAAGSYISLDAVNLLVCVHMLYTHTHTHARSICPLRFSQKFGNRFFSTFLIWLGWDGYCQHVWRLIAIANPSTMCICQRRPIFRTLFSHPFTYAHCSHSLIPTKLIPFLSFSIIHFIFSFHFDR